MSQECYEYLKNRKPVLRGLTVETNNPDYPTRQVIEYMKLAVMHKIRSDPMYMENLYTYQGNIKIFSLYLDPTFNFYARTKSLTLADELYNEDEVEMISLVNVYYDWLNNGVTETNKVNQYSPGKLILVFEEQIFINIVLRIYIVNTTRDDKNNIILDFNGFFKSELMQ